jgi:hypothetical protein
VNDELAKIQKEAAIAQFKVTWYFHEFTQNGVGLLGLILGPSE